MLTRPGSCSSLPLLAFRMLWVAILFLSTFLPPAQSLRAQSSETVSSDSSMVPAPQSQAVESDAPTTVLPASLDATPQTVPIDRYFGNLPAPRTFMATATVLPQKRALLIGGQDTAGTPTSQILAVDMAGGTSTILGNLPVALTRMAAAYSPNNDTVYTFGGDNGNQRVNTIYAINPTTGGVRTLAATLPVALIQIGAVYHPWLNKILLIGGSTNIVNGSTRTIYLFDPTTETISASFANSMPVGFASVMAVYSAAVDKIFYVGSSNTSLFAVTMNGDAAPPTIETIANVWPVADGGPALIADDNTQLLYLMGNTQKRLIAYDPLFGQSWQTQITLPDALGSASLLFDAQSHHALALGGSRAGKAQNTIWRIPLGIGPQIALGRWEFPKANGATIGNISAIDGDERRVFVGTTNAGVYRFQGESESYTFFSAAKVGQVNNIKYDLYNNQGWIATNAGAKRITQANVVSTFGSNDPGVATNLISAIDVMPNVTSDLGSRPFLGTYYELGIGSSRGVIWRDISGGFPGNNFWSQNFASNENNYAIQALAHKKYGELYVVANHQLKRLNYNYTLFGGYTANETTIGNPCGQPYNDLAISKRGDWWLTSDYFIPEIVAADPNTPNAPSGYEGGICRIRAADPTHGNFFNPDINGFPHKRANSVTVDSDDRVWVGFGDGGLVQYQVLQTPAISEQLRYMTYTTPVGFVYAVGAVDEKVWMDSRPSTGLTTYAQRWQVLDQSNGLQNKQVTGAWLARGRAFFASNAGELMMLTPDGLTWTNFAGANAHVVFGDSRGVIWVGTDTGLRWLTSAGLAGISPLEGNAPTGKINAITEDKQGRIWIGHSAGLTLFDRNRFVATFTQTNSPLVSNAVSALQVDSSNALWIGTDAGLNKLDIATWSAYSTNNGLPSVNIHDLALTGNGSIAVSTLSGLAILSGTTFVTETMPIAAANLPLTVDEVGRLWAGTAVRTQHNQWQGYWTTNSGLKHSMASDVVADGADRVWFAHGDPNKFGVSVRGALLPALDGIQPQIFSVAPNHGSAGTTVTITGSGFGENGADVQLSIGGSKLDILSIRDDQIQTVIRPETGSGRVQLVIRGKSLAYGSLTAADNNQAPDYAFETAGFCATPVISEMTPTGGNAGVDVEIRGTNFDAYWGKVLINGVEHQASGSPTLIRFRIQPNDVSGTLVFENRYPGCAQDGFESDTASQEFRKLNANIGLMRLNQGYAGLGLVIGKPTLAQSFITTDAERRSSDRIEVDSIETVFTSGSTSVQETHANLLPVPSTVGSVPESRKKDIEHSLNAWLWPDLPNPSNDEAEADWQVQTTLRRNGFVVAQTTKSFTFQRNYKVRMLLVPYLLGGTIDQATGLPNLCNGYFYSCDELNQLRQNVETHLENLRYRLHPFGEVQFEWSNTVKLAATDEITIKDTTDLYFEGHWMSDKRSEWNDAHNPDVVIVFGLVDSRVAKDSGGFAFQNDMSELANIGLSAIDAICHLGDPITLIITAIMGDSCDVEFPTYVGWASVSVAPEKGEDVSSLIGHEMGHILGLVKPSAGNATHSWDGADYNESHSKYDELRNGQRGDSQAVYSSDLTLYREEGVKEPVVNPITQEQFKADLSNPEKAKAKRGKALMSYAYERHANNTFFEPPDLAHMKMSAVLSSVFGWLSFFAGGVEQADANQLPDNTKLAVSLQAKAEQVGGDRLAVTGVITPGNNSGEISTVLALSANAPVGLEVNTAWELVQLDANNQVLARSKVFAVAPSAPHAHDEEEVKELAAAMFHGSLTVQSLFFSQSLIKADGLKTLQLRKHTATEEIIMDSFSAGANAPVVSLSSPNGGNYTSTIPVAWNASDVDGDPLTILIEYSADDGTTWIPAGNASGAGAGNLNVPLFALSGSNTARIRVTAKDGFNRGSVTSPAFVVSSQPPRPYIAQPSGESMLEGQQVMLVGGAYDNQDEQVAASGLTWRSDRDGLLGTGSQLGKNLSVGTHLITLTAVNSAGLQATTTTTVTIVGDYDMDGLADTIELASGLTPLTESDGLGDPDGDGLATNVEISRGTNPNKADSDGDGRSDASEIIDVTDPVTNDPPPPADVLIVAPNVITLTYDASSDTPFPQAVVYLSSRNPVSWTASANVNWLVGSAKTGQTPDSFTMAALTYQLGDGTYTAHLTVKSDLGTVNVPVTLVLTGSNGYCDVNRDGTSNNSDVALVQAALGTNNSQPSFNYRNDLDRNGSVTAEDVTLAQLCIASGGDRRVYLPIVSR